MLTRLAALGLVVAALIAFAGGGHRCLSLAYPPRTDQDGYLEAARPAAEGVLLERSPFYSLWMGAFYRVEGGDLHRTFDAEKLASTLLLALGTGLAGWRLFGGPTGILAAGWVMNCKYLLHESNGSHTFAAVAWMTGVLLLVSSLRARRELSLIPFFLATQVRNEMWAPFLLTAAWLTARDWSLRGRAGAGRLLAGWCAALLVCAASWALLHAHTHGPPMRLEVSFRQSFARTYAERHRLLERFPDSWSTWPAVWDAALPGAPDAASAVRKYPGALLSHVAYQAGLSLRVLPAMVLAFDRPLLMVALLGCYAGSAAWRRERIIALTEPDRSSDAVVAGLALVVLIPISCVVRVAARNYIQLIPLELFAIVLALRAGLRALADGRLRRA